VKCACPVECEHYSIGTCPVEWGNYYKGSLFHWDPMNSNFKWNPFRKKEKTTSTFKRTKK
jgi:hypothetical protein